MAGGDVEEAELVGAGFVVDHGLFHRIASVAQIEKVHAFDDAAVFHIETGDDAGFEHQLRIRAIAAMVKKARAVTASAGTAVVRVRASVSSRRSQASSRRSSLQRLTCALNEAVRAKWIRSEERR